MRVLVDTSVWSLALRRKIPSAQTEVLRLTELISDGQPIFLTGIILVEILQGIKEQPQSLRMRQYLEVFPLIELDRAGYINAARLSSRCRSKGIQSGTVDALIAQTAIEHGCYLLTADQDFAQIARYSDLKLL